MDFRIQSLELDGKLVKLHLWDTAGQERFRSLTRGYYRGKSDNHFSCSHLFSAISDHYSCFLFSFAGAHAVSLCFDLTDRESFEHCTDWVKDIRTYARPDGVAVLVGTKVASG